MLPLPRKNEEIAWGWKLHLREVRVNRRRFTATKIYSKSILMLCCPTIIYISLDCTPHDFGGQMILLFLVLVSNDVRYSEKGTYWKLFQISLIQTCIKILSVSSLIRTFLVLGYRSGMRWVPGWTGPPDHIVYLPESVTVLEGLGSVSATVLRQELKL